MTFLHFGLLSLAGLVAVPLLLHLLTLYRLRTVELSTFRFLFDSYVQQRRRIKFLEAILAILRALFVLFIVLVVARPVLTNWLGLFGGVSGSDCLMLVDCSASMNARIAGRTSMDRARSSAVAVAQRLPGDKRLTLVRLTTEAEVVFSRFASDADIIRQSIESLRASPARANLYAALSELFASDTYRQPRQTIYYFTDCQSSSWREIKEQGLARMLPAESKFIVVNVGSNEALSNRAVVGEPPAEARVVVGLPVLLRARIANHSKTAAPRIAVAVSIADREIAQAAVSLEPGEVATRELVYVPRSVGSQRGRFEITSDSFPDDDSYLFTLQVVPAIKVLIVNGFASTDPFQTESLYIRTALQAESPVTESGQRGANPLADLAPSRDFVQSLDVQEIAENALNPAALNDASVVILANAGSLNAQHFSWLREYVANGGGLLIFPGDRVNHEVYTKQFFAALAAQPPRNAARKPAPARPGGKGNAASPADPLVDAALHAPTGDLERLDSIDRFANIFFTHPVFSVFDDPAGRYLSTAQFHRRFRIGMANEATATWPLAYFQSGEPAVVESHFSRGTVLLAAFPANPKWSNLPLKPEFVPLLLRMINYVMRPSEFSNPSVVPAGTVAELSVATGWGPSSGKVTQPNGQASPMQFERSQGQFAATFANTADKGYYAVELNGGTVDQPRHADVAFAVNLSPDESDFEMISRENLREWLPGSDAVLVDASAQTELVAGEVGEVREVWRPLILIMFVIIAVEFLLSTLSTARDHELPTIAERIRRISPVHWVGRMTGGTSISEEQTRQSQQ